MIIKKQVKTVAVLFSMLSIAACTSVPRDGGVSEVEKIYS
jgi:hypothetical protein